MFVDLRNGRLDHALIEVREPLKFALGNAKNRPQFRHGEGLGDDVIEVHEAGDVLKQQHGILAAKVEHGLPVKDGPMVRLRRHAPEGAPEPPRHQQIAAHLVAVVHHGLVQQPADGDALLFGVIVDQDGGAQFGEQGVRLARS